MKNKIYEVSLYMIDNSNESDIESATKKLCDLKKTKMAYILAYMPMRSVKKIIVYKKFGKFREIITDIEVPALEKFQGKYSGIVTRSMTLEKPLFFKYRKHKSDYNSYYPLLSELVVNSRKLEKYIRENLDNLNKDVDLNYAEPKELYKKQLEDLFKKAEDVYNDVILKEELETKDNVKVKKILKKYNLK